MICKNFAVWIKQLFIQAQRSRCEHLYGLIAGRSTKLQSERSTLSGPISFLMPRTLSIDRDLLDRRALSAFTVFLGYAVFEACIAALSLWKRLAYIYCTSTAKSARFLLQGQDLYSCKKPARAYSYIKYWVFLRLIFDICRHLTIARFNNYCLKLFEIMT